MFRLSIFAPIIAGKSARPVQLSGHSRQAISRRGAESSSSTPVDKNRSFRRLFSYCRRETQGNGILMSIWDLVSAHAEQAAATDARSWRPPMPKIPPNSAAIMLAVVCDWRYAEGMPVANKIWLPVTQHAPFGCENCPLPCGYVS